MRSFYETFFSSFLIILFLGLGIPLMLGSSLCMADQNVLTIGDPNPQQMGAVSDDHSNTRDQATIVGPESSTPGVLERGGDLDYFQITVTEAGTLTVGTTGTIDTAGVLRGSTGAVLAQNNDSGMEGGNFQIVQDVSAETRIYVGVSGHNDQETGRYRLFVLFTPTDQVVSNLRNLLGTWRFEITYLMPRNWKNYQFHSVVNTTGTPFMTGADASGDPIIAGRIQDIAPGNKYSKREFALFDPYHSNDDTNKTGCEIFLFDFDKERKEAIKGIVLNDSGNEDCADRNIDRVVHANRFIQSPSVYGMRINKSSQGRLPGDHLLKKR